MAVPEILVFTAIGVLWVPLVLVALYLLRRKTTGTGTMTAAQLVAIAARGLPPPESKRPWPTDLPEGEGRVEVSPEYADALDGLEGFSHLFVLSHLSRVRDDARGPFRINPGLHHDGPSPSKDLPEVGVFATDSSHQPNPVSLTIVKLVRREGNVLVVRGIDLYDGTPVLDLKPYRADYKAKRHTIPACAAGGDPKRQPL